MFCDLSFVKLMHSLKMSSPRGDGGSYLTKQKMLPMPGVDDHLRLHDSGCVACFSLRNVKFKEAKTATV